MVSDISERTAGLNTQMRFGNYRAALSLAYRLRLDLQLSQPQTPKIYRELESVESVIENLERLKISKFQHWARRFWDTVLESVHTPVEVIPIDLSTLPVGPGSGELPTADSSPPHGSSQTYLGSGDQHLGIRE